jgi:GTP-binding protein
MITSENIRNIAIIAHVDHGKTSLVDKLLEEGGTFHANQQVEERVMDSMDLEREKGITIKAKNTSVHWKDCIINIVDTPGHADFGAEVERVMKMVDGVLLLVDAYEGPQAQTRFVLKKALENDLQLIVVVNKVDRENADPEGMHDKVLELLMELNAEEHQFDCPFLYGSAKQGWCNTTLDGSRENMEDLFTTVLDHIPAPKVEEGSFKMLVSNIDWDDYVGRVAIGKVLSGTVAKGDTIYVIHDDGSSTPVKVTKVFEYSGVKTSNVDVVVPGNIIGISGFEDVNIGETLSADTKTEPLAFVAIDPPTIQMEFVVNDGPLAGRDGKKVTSRQIRERLEREKKSNISIQVEEGEGGKTFLVSARGAMQIAVLVETMRREGFEVCVSRPKVIYKYTNDIRCEPYENIWVEVPETELGTIMENLANRKAQIQNMNHHESGRVTVEANIPTRGLIGFESDLVSVTSGHGIMSHLFDTYKPYAGEIVTRQTGTLVSMDQGQAKGYALDTLQARGRLFIGEGDDVYGGMIVGENPRKTDMPVNPTKAKQLTNHRAAGKDKNAALAPPVQFSLERAIEYIAPDEFVEATPKLIRLRKRILDPHERKRAEARHQS